MSESTVSMIIGGIKLTKTSVGDTDLTKLPVLNDDGKIDGSYLKQMEVIITNPIMNISHNFGYIPKVTIVDNLDKVWEGGVTSIDENIVSLNVGDLSGRILLR